MRIFFLSCSGASSHIACPDQYPAKSAALWLALAKSSSAQSPGASEHWMRWLASCSSPQSQAPDPSRHPHFTRFTLVLDTPVLILLSVFQSFQSWSFQVGRHSMDGIINVCWSATHSWSRACPGGTEVLLMLA